MTARRKILPDEQPFRTPRELLQRYYDLFRPCAINGCYDLADTRSKFCDRCSSNREFEARMAAMRAARGMGR